jgi:hypothetical protein
VSRFAATRPLQGFKPIETVPSIAFESAARPLLVLHAVVGFALLGASTHLLVVCVQLWRGRVHLGRLARVYAQVIGATFTASFVLGLVMYPHYRYHVRGLYLDRYEPWASNLFDMKETFAALALPLAIALLPVGRRLDPARERDLLPLVTLLAAAVWATAAFAAVAGVLVTGVRGV